MPGTVPVSITDDVSDTLFIPLYMRSLETQRSDGVIHDPLSCELVDRIEYDFTKYEKSPKSQLGTSIRIRSFDEAVIDFVAANENPVVVNIGAGLDTRFQRTYRGKGIFYDLDLPDVISFRKQLIPESENNHYMPVSMFDTEWMDTIRENHPNARFILLAEGVFMYFEKDRIQPLVTEIAEKIGPGELHFDVTSSWGVKTSRRHETVKKTNAMFKWGIDDDRLLEEWSPKLQYMRTTNYFCFRRARWGMMGLVSMVWPTLKNAYRMLHYEIKA